MSSILQLWIDIEDSAGNKQGPGPIRDFVRWRHTQRLDRAGTFEFEMPAASDRAALVQARRIARCYAMSSAGTNKPRIIEIGAGIIDTIRTTVGIDGRTMLRVAGDDLLRELSFRSVAFLEIDDGSGGPADDALDSIIALAPSGWTLDEVNGHGATAGTVYARFAGESVLTALVKVAEHLGEHFRLGAGRTVVWMQTDQADSGIRMQQTLQPTTIENRSDLALLTRLEKLQDSYGLISRVYPYGAGEGQARLTLAACTRSPASGWTLSTTGNYIKRNATETSYGQIERHVQWKELAPISNTDADLTAAANQLYDVALEYLTRNSAIYSSYRLDVAKLDGTLNVGSTVRVVYREVVDGGYVAINIDEDLVVLESTTEIDENGIRTTGLVVATTDRWPTTDQETLISQLQQGVIFQAHPQLNANSYTTHYTPHVDADTPATFRFRLGAEVAQVNQVLLEFTLLPLTSTIKTISGSSSTTANGGAATVTSAGESNHTHQYSVDHDVSGTQYPVKIEPNAGGTGVHRLVADMGGTSYTIDTGAGGTHAHDVVIANHTHTVTPNITTTYGIYEANVNTVFATTDLDYQVNGGSWYDLDTDLVSLGDSWYQLDLTSKVSSSTTFRPNQATNTVKIRRKTSGSFSTRAYAQIDALLQVRNIIQSVAYS